jgi:hypothetical protein
VAARKITLTPRHKEVRVGFALQHLPQDDAFWSRVVFSDEKSFQSCPNGRIRIYRPRNTRYEERYVDATDRSGRFSVGKYVGLDFGGSGGNLTCGGEVFLISPHVDAEEWIVNPLYRLWVKHQLFITY